MSGRTGLGTRIRAARQARGWSHEELGRLVGVSQGTISGIERGATTGRTLHTVRRLVDLLELGGDPRQAASPRRWHWLGDRRGWCVSRRGRWPERAGGLRRAMATARSPELRT